MSDVADPLLDLFREEVAAAAGVIVGQLAATAPDPERLERAAAAVVSAAAIIGQDRGVAVARQLGEVFSSVRRGAMRLDAAVEAEVRVGLEELKRVAADNSPLPLGRQAGGEGTALQAEPSPETIPPAFVATTDADLPNSVPASAASDTAAPPPHLPPGGVGGKPDPASASLLELFREEVKGLCGALTNGLVELEADPTDPKRIEPLMRAAHSIKGAARIVHCEPAIDLAHEMEELLVSAQKGRAVVTPPAVDLLLTCADLLAGMADADLTEWAAANAAAVNARVTELKAVLAGKGAAPPVPPGPPPVRDERGMPTPAAPGPPVGDSPQPGVTPPPASPPAVAEPTAPPPPAPDQVVRISATSLTRLLSLAGESLVEARWLQPFSRSLLKLKKHQDHLADVLDDLCHALPADAPAGVAALDARARLAACRQVLADRIDEFESHARQSDELNSRLYREVITSRMRPFADGTHGFARMVRDVARQLGKRVRLEVRGQDVDVDRDILDKLEAPLGHILRNAVDHGLEGPDERRAAGKPEIGTIRVEARHHAGTLNVRVSDDGRGIDVGRIRKKVVDRKLTTPELAARMSEAELLEFLFLPGFSTKEAVSDVSGRGVGLDVVQATAQTVGGAVRVSTRPGGGSTFDLQLPITLSVVRAVLVTVSGDPFAIPLNRTDRLLRLDPQRVRTLEGKPHFETDGRHVGLVPAHLVFDLPAGPAAPADELAVVLVSDRAGQYGLLVDGFLGEQDLVVRPLDPRLGKVPNVSAASLLDDGSPVLIADVDDVTRSVAVLVAEGKLRHRRPDPRAVRKKRVLVVDDSAIVREAERQLLLSRGYEVDLAVDGADGWNAVRTGGYDLVVSDIDMPRMTGLELVRAIRTDPAVQSTPVVIVSYKDRPEDRTRGLDVGANYYLTKSSFHDGKFLAAVADLIGDPEG
jgi:two-component system sensor histidine kinase and response regulator WspE